MPLPSPWVDRIFDKLTLVYGQAFLRKWDSIDMGAVKADWAHELAGFEHHPKAIAWALQNLVPDRAPNALWRRSVARGGVVIAALLVLAPSLVAITWGVWTPPVLTVPLLAFLAAHLTMDAAARVVDRVKGDHSLFAGLLALAAVLTLPVYLAALVWATVIGVSP